MPKPVHPNATRACESDPVAPMTADEAMDILSAAVQRAVARIMAAEAAQGTKQDAHAVNAAKRSQSHA